MKTLYVSDLDGTLLNSNAMLSDYTKNTINYLVDKGVYFSYATARSLNSASYINEGLTINLPLIVYNGTFILDSKSKKILHQESFYSHVLEQLMDVFLTYKRYPMVYSYIDFKERISYIEDLVTEGEQYYLSCRKGDKRLRISTIDNLYEGEIFYYTLIGPHEELLELYNDVKKISGLTAYLQAEIYRDEYWLEIMPKKATKAHAVIELKKLLNCDRIVSFGDALNDIPMFQISDECYAVSNAVDELKEIATGIIASNNEDGVAHWLMEHSL